MDTLHNEMKHSLSGAETCAFNKMCRLCLRVENHLISIFTDKEKSKCLVSRIRDCCPITLEDDRLPKMICHECEEKVAATFEFREQCRKSEHFLRSHYESCISDKLDLVKISNYKTILDCNVKANSNMCTNLDVIDLNEDSEKNQQAFNERKSENSILNAQYERKKIFESKLVHNEIVEEKVMMKSISPFFNDDRNHDEKEKNKKKDKMIDQIYFFNNEHKYIEKESGDNISKESGDNTSKESGDNISTEKMKICNDTMKMLYLCDICSKTFASKSGLRFHLKSHDAVKSYPCRYCDKRFVIPSYTKRHEKIHTGDKPFICQYCSVTFASSNGLKYHLRLHTGEANYSCEICGKCFYRHKYLKEHIFTHTGEKPYICKTCGASYGSSGSLFVHKKKCKTI